WIEIKQWAIRCVHEAVAPARERGLKSTSSMRYGAMVSRSREGAWIEIRMRLMLSVISVRRSREGAWIEILALQGLYLSAL
ncbi:hypothetical protein, partial [uncultured Phascolarctobacterium sp.]|uniref:hypothetical protein n=1 Tax=uncultured Phascolarctobacterium sp. TaxID=512296 RepID=UPI0025D7EB71